VIDADSDDDVAEAGIMEKHMHFYTSNFVKLVSSCQAGYTRLGVESPRTILRRRPFCCSKPRKAKTGIMKGEASTDYQKRLIRIFGAFSYQQFMIPGTRKAGLLGPWRGRQAALAAGEIIQLRDPAAISSLTV
jgi:hypothetical protein